jgi:hypothetical protein
MLLPPEKKLNPSPQLGARGLPAVPPKLTKHRLIHLKPNNVGYSAPATVSPKQLQGEFNVSGYRFSPPIGSL